MVRWRYRSATVFFLGLALAVILFVTVAGSAWLTSGSGSLAAELESLLPGDILIRHPLSPSPARLFEAGGRLKARPLACSRECLDLLTARPGTATVLPFSLGRLSLKGDLPDLAPIGGLFAVAVPPSAWPEVRARLVMERGGLAAGLEHGLVLSEAFLKQREGGGSRPVRPGDRFFLDAGDAPDRFNLSAVRFLGSFSLPGAAPDSPLGEFCFIDPLTFLKAGWRTHREFMDGTLSRAPERLPFTENIPRGEPLTYEFLFTADSVEVRNTHPTYLLVRLKPGERPAREAVLAEEKRVLQKNRLEAEAELWDPAAFRLDPWPRVQAPAVILGLALIALILIANLALKPVPREALPEEEKAPPSSLLRFRPSFPARHAWIALTAGAAGALSALAAIFLYNRLTEPGLRRMVSDLLTASTGVDSAVERVRLSPAGLTAAGAGLIAFALLTLPGPLLRAVRLSRRLLAADRTKLQTDDTRPSAGEGDGGEMAAGPPGRSE